MTTLRPRSEKLEYLRKCSDSLRDWSAHQKFLKYSGLIYSGEISRRNFPIGSEDGLKGWELWKMQFASNPEKDLSLVENELKRLYDRHRLNTDEYERLRRLYGLATQVDAQSPRRAIMEMCRCGEKLTWTPEYNRYFCHKCRQYPPTCPDCQHDVFWVREYNRHYCNTCGKYR